MNEPSEIARRFGVELVSREIVHRARKFQIERLTEQFPGGAQLTRDIVRHPGAVVILPILGDGRIVMIEQFRSALGTTLLELPAGTLEPGEDPRLAAARELTEETGYHAGTLEAGPVFYPAPGVSDELMRVFVARNLEKREQALELGECLEVRLFTPQAIEQLFATGRIRDAKTWIALRECALTSKPAQRGP